MSNVIASEVAARNPLRQPSRLAIRAVRAPSTTTSAPAT
ncbi:hypothetical protein CgS9114_15103 [Corynebacterium glutamicum S9114]|nr:hypothetical protein CgS9114_15103 [Corynebacterium glutamicum S9114]